MDDALAPSTVRRRISNTKQFFQDAVERGIIDRNPFAGPKGAFGSNRARDYFLNREDAAKDIDACPDAQMTSHLRVESRQRTAVPE